MGDVYLARDPSLERPVAIKVLRSAHQDDPDFRARFEREARAVARLRHPNIVIIFEFGVDEGSPFMAMEYIAGVTLKELLAGDSVPSLVRRIEIIEELCSGLAHAHRHEIIHRDIKPVNLMIDTEGVLKILDFGIARIGESQTQSGIMGTFPYMSPEQALGTEIGKKSDIFAVGSVLYETLTLRQAFPGEGASPLQKIVSGDYVPIEEYLPGIDPHLAAIVRRALERDPANRHPGVKELHGELAQIRKRLAAHGDEGDVSSKTIITPQRVPRSDSRSGDSDRRRGLTPEREAELRKLQVEEYVQGAQAALASKNYDGALLAAERALALDRNNRAALSVMDEARFASEATAVRRLFARARELEEQQQLDDALTVAREAQDACTVLPDVTGARTLRSEARDLVDQISAARERQQTVDRSLTHARRSVDNGEYETALRAVYQVLALDPDHVEARSIEHRAQTRLREQRDQERARRLALEQVTAAQELATAGRYQDALAALTVIRDDSATVRSAADNVRAIIAAGEKQAATAKAVDEAQRAFHRREFAIAVAALAGIPDAELTPQAREVKAAAEAALEQQREAERRRRALNERIVEIQALIDAGDYEQALDRVRTAAELEPADERLRVLRQRAGELRAAADAKRRQELLDRQAASLVASARTMATRGELTAAVALLEEAEATHPLIEAAVSELRTRIERERLRREADERERRDEEARRQAAAEAERRAVAAAQRAEDERQRREQGEREEAARQQAQAAREAEIERQRQREESTVLISAAEAALEGGRLDEATVLLTRAQPILPRDEQALQTRVSNAKAQIARQHDIARREQARREAEARAAEAERKRREAVAAAEKAATEQRAEEERQAEVARERDRLRARDAKVAALVSAAAQEKSPAAALTLLQSALELTPDDRKIASQIARRQREIRELEAESARRASIERAQAEIDAALQHADLNEAQRLLTSAERQFEPASFKAFRLRLDAQHRAATAAEAAKKKAAARSGHTPPPRPWYQRPAIAGPIAAAVLSAITAGVWWSSPQPPGPVGPAEKGDNGAAAALAAVVQKARDQYQRGDRAGAVETSLTGLQQQDGHPPLVELLADIRRDVTGGVDAAQARAETAGAAKTDIYRSANDRRAAADKLWSSDIRGALAAYEDAQNLYVQAGGSVLSVQQLMASAEQAYKNGQLQMAVTYAEQVLGKDSAHAAARQLLRNIRTSEVQNARDARSRAMSAQAGDQPAFREGEARMAEAGALGDRETWKQIILLRDARESFASAEKTNTDEDVAVAAKRREDATAWHRRAEASLVAGNLEQAQREIEQSLKLDATTDAQQTRSAIEKAIIDRAAQVATSKRRSDLERDIDAALKSDQAIAQLESLQTRANEFLDLKSRIDSALAGLRRKAEPIPGPPPSVDRRAEVENEIRSLLARYVEAYNRFDNAGVRSTLPGAEIANRQQLRGVVIRLDIKRIDVAENFLTATVESTQSFKYSWDRKGPPEEAVVSENWTLAKQNGRWVLVRK
jgi:serine/threonine protein kinase